MVFPAGLVKQLGEPTLLFGKGLLCCQWRGNPVVERSQGLADWGVVTNSLIKVASVQGRSLCNSGSNRSQVCCSSITGCRAKAKSSLGKGPACLLPLGVVEVDSAIGAEATFTARSDSASAP